MDATQPDTPEVEPISPHDLPTDDGGFDHCDHVEECRRDPSSTYCGADPCNLARRWLKDSGTKSVTVTLSNSLAPLGSSDLRDELVGAYLSMVIERLMLEGTDHADSIETLGRARELVQEGDVR